VNVLHLTHPLTQIYILVVILYVEKVVKRLHLIWSKRFHTGSQIQRTVKWTLQVASSYTVQSLHFLYPSDSGLMTEAWKPELHDLGGFDRAGL